MKIGMGNDIHRLARGRVMVLGGVKLPYSKGPEGHSDGDVLIHAICDAILGALGEGDIGMRFPDTDPGFKDTSSSEFLEDVVDLMSKKGMGVGNLDCTVILEEPRIGPYREKIVSLISGMLGIPKEDVNLKAKTCEKLGVIGKGEAVAAYAVVLLKKIK